MTTRSYPRQVKGTIEEAWKGIRDAFDAIFSLQNDTAKLSSMASPLKNSVVVIEDKLINLTLYPPANYPLGSRFLATDKGNAEYAITLVSQAPAWVFLSGQLSGNQANLPGGLGASEAGLLYSVTDYHHLLRWNGAAWEFGPGDSGSRFIVATVGAAPIGGLWQVCDGTAVTVLNSNGTTSSVATPALTTQLNGDNIFIQGGSAYTAPNVTATQPTWQAGAKTDDENAHTHTVNVGPLTVNIPATGTPTVVGAPGNRTSTGPTSPNAHNLTNANAKLNPPSEVSGGMPARVVLTWFMRR